MSARSFGSLTMVASCAGAALGCYLVSLRVASERAAVEAVETRIVAAQRDMRVLQTEIGTRGRLAQLERFERQTADGRAVQRAAVIAGRSQHALDLVVLALLQDNFKQVLPALNAAQRGQRRRFVVQLDASQQLGHQLRRHRLGRGGLINLGNMPFG